MSGTSWILAGAERRWWPDSAIRWGIRRLLHQRLHRCQNDPLGSCQPSSLADQLRTAPITLATDAANAQHYEVPTEFFDRVLGPYRKYSCGFWNNATSTLEDSERTMLEMTIERAEVVDGMELLDLGCGWGSLTRYLAERFPNCRITAVSNSHSQRQSIEAMCHARQFSHVQVETADIAHFQPTRQFDRILSVEMLEHVRNHHALFQRIAGWLRPGGKLFIHVFCHRQFAYLFEDRSAQDWMSRHFFAGGMMPSFDWFQHITGHLVPEADWAVSGEHYARTCNAWLARLDNQFDDVLRLFSNQMGRSQASLQVQRWRMFFMACEELFAFDRGRQWHVGHYRLRPRSEN